MRTESHEHFGSNLVLLLLELAHYATTQTGFGILYTNITS